MSDEKNTAEPPSSSLIPHPSSLSSRTVIPELMDRTDASPDELVDDLHDLMWLNRFGGARTLVLDHVREVIGRHPSQKHWTLLDVATGSADIPRHLVQWARRERIDLQITGIDLHPVTLDFARRMSQSYPEISLESANLLNLPYPADSYDIVTCSQVLHHFDTEQIITALRHLRRVARRAVILSDLRRGRFGHALIWLIVRCGVWSRLARHDGPASMRNGFSRRELEQLARAAGMDPHLVCRQQILRLGAVWTKQSPA